MKNISKTAVLFISALLVTALAAGFYAFFFVAMKNKTQAVTDLTLKNEELIGKESRVAAVMGALSDEAANIAKLAGYFIKASDIVPFTKNIEALGPLSGTDLSIESLEPGVGTDGAPTLSIRLKATGEFENVMRLLAFLENFPAKFEWKTVQLSVLDETAPHGEKKAAPRARQWSLSISVVALNFTQE